MSGETRGSVSGWTVDTLHEHVNTQLDDLKDLLQERFDQQTVAITAAMAAVEKRFDGVNEFRKALSDQTATFMPRTEIEQRQSSVGARADEASARNAARITDIELRLQTVPTTAERDVLTGASLARDAALGDRVTKMELLAGSNTGRTQGVHASWGFVYAGLTLLSTLVAVILAVYLAIKP
jgi:hypothetical protein